MLKKIIFLLFVARSASVFAAACGGSPNVGTATPIIADVHCSGVTNSGDVDRWWQLTVNASGDYVVSTGSAFLGANTTNYDTTLTVYSDAGITQIAFNDDIDLMGGNQKSEVVVNLTAYTSYWVKVSSFGGLYGMYTIEATAQSLGPVCGSSNTSFGAATSIPMFTYSTAGTTESTCTDLYWSYTSPSNQVVSITTDDSGTDYDTKLELYNASQTLVATNDDINPVSGNNKSKIKHYSMSAGQLYYIKVTGYYDGVNTDYGNFTMTAYADTPVAGPDGGHDWIKGTLSSACTHAGRGPLGAGAIFFDGQSFADDFTIGVDQCERGAEGLNFGRTGGAFGYIFPLASSLNFGGTFTPRVDMTYGNSTIPILDFTSVQILPPIKADMKYPMVAVVANCPAPVVLNWMFWQVPNGYPQTNIMYGKVNYTGAQVFYTEGNVFFPAPATQWAGSVDMQMTACSDGVVTTSQTGQAQLAGVGRMNTEGMYSYTAFDTRNMTIGFPEPAGGHIPANYANRNYAGFMRDSQEVTTLHDNFHTTMATTADGSTYTIYPVDPRTGNTDGPFTQTLTRIASNVPSSGFWTASLSGRGSMVTVACMSHASGSNRITTCSGPSPTVPGQIWQMFMVSAP